MNRISFTVILIQKIRKEEIKIIIINLTNNKIKTDPEIKVKIYLFYLHQEGI
jgi:carbamoylphosphate synthase large subunit